MVEHADAEQLTGLDEALGDWKILVAWLGVAGRVVVNQHDRGRRGEDGGFEHLARMNHRRVQAANGDGLLGHNLVAGIQEQDEKVLALFPMELPPNHGTHIVRSADLARLLAAVLPLRHFADMHRSRSAGGGVEKGAPGANAWSPVEWNERWNNCREKVRGAVDVSASTAVRGPR